MRILKFIAVGFLCIGFTGLNVKGQGAAGPLSQFRGDYQIAAGPRGTVRVSDALGGSYTEWAVTFGQPSHELRMFVGARNGDGTFRVWRFEQEPSPGVTARLEGQELIADFPHVEGPPGDRSSLN